MKKFKVLTFDVQHIKGRTGMIKDYRLNQLKEGYLGAAIIVEFTVEDYPRKLQYKFYTSSPKDIDKKIEIATKYLKNVSEVIVTDTTWKVSKQTKFLKEMELEIG